MTWVKVCGLRTPEDVDVATESGADAIGLVLAPSSRRIDVDVARALAARTHLLSVVVTVDLLPADVLALARRVGAGGVQPHGLHGPDAASAAADAGLFVLQPVRMADHVPDLAEIPDDHIPLLDTHRPNTEGGTGVRFDWALIPAGDRPFVLAGGLGPESIGEALASVRPWGVDASSGLESSPGVKDHDRIRTFVEGAKA